MFREKGICYYMKNIFPFHDFESSEKNVKLEYKHTSCQA